MKNKWATAAFILLFLAISAYLLSGIMAVFVSDEYQAGNVMVIPIKGTIVADEPPNFWEETYASSSQIIKLINDVEKDDTLDAVIFDINSPGGGAVASYEIMEAIKKMNKTSVAVIREVGASGAYWAATATDHIFASPLSIVGSVGVISSYLDFSEFIEDWNVSYQRLVSGKYKDTGIPYRELTDEEVDMIQTRLDKVKKIFLDSVVENRVLSQDEIAKIDEGQVFLGTESVDLELVDALGNIQDAKSYLREKLNKTVTLKEYRQKRTLADMLRISADANMFRIGEGIGSRLLEEDSNNVMRT